MSSYERKMMMNNRKYVEKWKGEGKIDDDDEENKIPVGNGGGEV